MGGLSCLFLNMQFNNHSIRLITREDTEKLFNLIDRNRSRLEDFFAGTVSKTKTLADTKDFVADVLQRIAEKKYYAYLIINDESNDIVGYIDVKNIDWSIPKAEFGCYFDIEHCGKGLATVAMNKVIAHLFNEEGFLKLFLRTHKKNVAARKLAEKCGFEVEGVIRKDYKKTNGEVVDLVYYGLVKP